MKPAAVLLLSGLLVWPASLVARMPGDSLADPSAGSLDLNRLVKIVPTGPADESEGEQELTDSRWYASDPLGFAYREIGWYRTSDFEWTLHRDFKTGVPRDILTLYHKGEMVQKQERSLYADGTPRTVLTLREGDRQSFLSLDAQGKAVQETLYEKGAEKYRLEYLYRGWDLIQLITRNAAGDSLWTDVFSRTPQGRLRRVVRTFADGSSTESAWVYGSSGLVLEWTREGKTEKSYRYNADGLLTVQQLVEEGKLASTRTWVWKDKVLESFSEVIPDQDNETRQTLGVNGLVAKEEILYKGDVVATTVYSYDDKKKLLSRDRSRGTIQEHWELTYSPDGQQTGETYKVNGQLDTVSTLKDGDLVLEELYYDGEKVLEVEYAKGEKVKERFFRDGKVLRERDPRVAQ